MSRSNIEFHISENPYEIILTECKKLLKQSLESSFYEVRDVEFKLEETPSPNFGDLSTILCFQLSKTLGKSPREIAENIINSIKIEKDSFLKSIEVAGSGYINFYLNYDKINELTLNSIRTLKDKYGFPKKDKPEQIILEHSSINPIHPIHIGQARNTILGDALARILRARGHKVEVHFYVNDAGRQSAILAYGFDKLGQPESTTKSDLYLGHIYSITSYYVEIQSLKNKLTQKSDTTFLEERIELQKKVDEWISVAFELQNQYPDLFEKLQKEMSKDSDLEGRVNTLLKDYESQAEPTKTLIRKVSKLCIDGFKETFYKLDVHFDVWDWESDLLWSGRVADVLKKIINTQYVTRLNGLLRLESNKAVDELKLRKHLDIGDDYVLPPVFLTRSDSTTLYTTRDIAYSLLKFERCKKVINVVGMEQIHEQLHVRVGLALLVSSELAGLQKHFTFGLVKFPGKRMRARFGRVITLDEVIDESLKRAYSEIEKRTPDLDPEEKQRMAEVIGISSIKYALLAVEPLHEVEFAWERVLNFEANSAPFINYGYTRANGILRKLGIVASDVNWTRLKDPLEKRLILNLAKFPSIFTDAADRLRPDDLAGYANQLTKQFHEYYEHVDVSHLKDDELKGARGALIEAIQVVIRNCMTTLGIRLSERM